MQDFFTCEPTQAARINRNPLAIKHTVPSVSTRPVKPAEKNRVRGYLPLQVLPLLSQRILFIVTDCAPDIAVFRTVLYFRPILNRTYSAEIPLYIIQGKQQAHII